MKTATSESEQSEGIPRRAIVTRSVRFSAAVRDAGFIDGGESTSGSALGHNYRVDVSLEGPIEPTTGMVINLSDLDRLLKQRVVDLLDRRFLDADVDYFKDIAASCENIAVFVAERIESELATGSAQLCCVRVWEDEDFYAELLLR